MNTTPSHSPTRALVLAGAGAAGNAWQLGLIAGLADTGVDLIEADLIVGTSAGATVGAQVTSGTLAADLYAAILAARPAALGSRPGARGGRGPMSGPQYMDWSDEIIAASADARDFRRRLAAAALELDADVNPGDNRWRDTVAARLPRHEWPEQRVLIPALDALTGEPVVFDRFDGIDLVDAVAASTSALTPYPVGKQRYLNGGYRRSSNADLAAGYARVLVLEPFGGRSRHPIDWGLSLNTQVEELRAGGSGVEVIFPDAGATDVFNANALDPSTRVPAARGGYAQGRALAGELSEFWG